MPIGGRDTYRRIQAETASPQELILRLYEGLIRDLERADAALQHAAAVEDVHGRLVHAQEIMMELLASLDLSAGDLAQQLADLYQYMYQRLVHANVHKDGSAVAEVLRLVRPIHEAWSTMTRSSMMPARLAA